MRFAGSHSHLITFAARLPSEVGYCRFTPHHSLMTWTIYFVEITESGDGVVIFIFREDLIFYFVDASVEVLADELQIIEALGNFAMRLLRGHGGRSRNLCTYRGFLFSQ